jgi:hypothetical protein
MKNITHPRDEVQVDQPHPPRVFLDRFPISLRRHVTNLFLEAVRAGADTPNMVVAAVAATAKQRLQTAQFWQNVAPERRPVRPPLAR